VNVRGEVFRDIDQLNPGDEVVVWVGEAAYPYRVGFTLRVPVTGAPASVQQDNLRWLEKTDDDRLTLITCWPYSSNTHRTIVVAFPIGEGEGGK
jgi:sortase A